MYKLLSKNGRTKLWSCQLSFAGKHSDTVCNVVGEHHLAARCKTVAPVPSWSSTSHPPYFNNHCKASMLPAAAASWAAVAPKITVISPDKSLKKILFLQALILKISTKGEKLQKSQLEIKETDFVFPDNY